MSEGIPEDTAWDTCYWNKAISSSEYIYLGHAQTIGLPLPTVVCVEYLPADKPWDVVSATRRSSGVASQACVRVYARVLVLPNIYIHTYTYCTLHSGAHSAITYPRHCLRKLSSLLAPSRIFTYVHICSLHSSAHHRVSATLFAEAFEPPRSIAHALQLD